MIDLHGLPDDVERVQRREREAPPMRGWEPGIRWDSEDEGEITSPGLTEALADPDLGWDEIITKLGLDSSVFAVVPPVQASFDPAAWHRDAQGQDAVTRPVWRYKARVVRRGSSAHTGSDTADIEKLADGIMSWKPPKRGVLTGEYTMFVDFADWQIGSADGRGTKAIVARVLSMIDDITNRLKSLRKMGYSIGRMHVQGMGDLFEGCTGHYAMQLFTVELDRREQTRVIRRLLVKALTTWAKLVEWITVGCVPGNHGEHRNGSGKAFTTFGDNDDVAVFEQVAEIFSANPALEHVKFSVPDKEMCQVFDLSGTIVAHIHAHQANRNKSRDGRKLPAQQAKVLTWWEENAFGDYIPGLADAHVLVSAHYHHYSYIEHGVRTHLQCPAMDDGSIWYVNQTGIHSRPGTLTGLAYAGSIEAVEIVGSGSSA